MSQRARSRFVGQALVLVAAALLAVSAGAACRTTAPTQTIVFSTTDLVAGTGATAALDQNLTVDYTGYIYDPNAVGGKGPVFETTTGGTPLTFVLAGSNVIQGWVQGVPGMRVGGTRRIIIPSALAYGTNAVAGKLPSNANLIFEITLISINPGS